MGNIDITVTNKFPAMIEIIMFINMIEFIT